MNNEGATPSQRILSVDLIRGAVMILMAIDHVRVYAAIPAGGPSPDIFFTRWITHFCAPAFLFLAGTSAFFYGRRHSDLSRFLITRGLWLVILELTVIRFGWTFNFDYGNYSLGGVIWVIGWSMVILSGLVKLPAHVVGVIGIIIMAGHNLLQWLQPAIGPSLGNDLKSILWKFTYIYSSPITVGADGPPIFVLYTLVPWVGIMAAGYGFGRFLLLGPARRNRLCLTIGLGAIGLFLVLRGFNIYGNPTIWNPPDGDWVVGLLSFLNVAKYPASLQFILMTLGPVVALIPCLERAKGRVADWIALFGRVPFFFYIVHIPLIHVLAMGISLLNLGEISPWLFANHPLVPPPPPEGYAWSLPALYAVWALTIVMLYFACLWYADMKSRRSDWWLKYI
ncbi:MAG: DUF1624 domain-containing protein [Ignavibacteriales bacterium]|nr:DUF1624 domain-containing protein [Ignavibacteriales bacterium]